MASRNLKNTILDLSAGVENNWPFPQGVTFFEIKMRENEPVKMSFVENGIQTGLYQTIESGGDWWTPPSINLPTGNKVYFKCDSNNVLEITYTQE